MPWLRPSGPARAAAALGAVWLTGCATNPSASLPAVQHLVEAAGGPRAEWAQTDSAKATAAAAVQGLLARPLTPDTAVRIAVLNSPALQATFEDLGLSEADLLAAGRVKNPTFFASSRAPDRDPRGPDVELSLTADLLDGLLMPVRKRVARAELESAEHRVAQAVLTLAEEVKVAAYTLEARQQFKVRLVAIAQANGLAAELARRQYEAGNINQLDLAMQQATAHEAQLECLRLDAQIQSDREALNRLLGLTGEETAWTMPGELPALPPAEPAAARLEATALHQRLDLAAAQTQVALAQAAFDLRRKLRYLPTTVDLGVDTERNPDGSRVTGPQLTIGLPLFDQGQADLARLGAALRRAQARAAEIAAEIGSAVRGARQALNAARAVTEFYDRTLLPERRFIVRQTLINYNAMQRNTYELLLAKEQEQRAEEAGLAARRDYWIARVRLEQALGGRLPAPESGATPPRAAS
jgi:cobalt-zinc-cadmium efflux system outer membrane protein